jgi:hypothetical protein
VREGTIDVGARARFVEHAKDVISERGGKVRKVVFHRHGRVLVQFTEKGRAGQLSGGPFHHEKEEQRNGE